MRNFRGLVTSLILPFVAASCEKNRAGAPQDTGSLDSESFNASLRTTLAALPNSEEPFIYAGLPSSLRDGERIKVLRNSGYVTGYSEKLGVARWVGYKLTKFAEPGTNLKAPLHEGLKFVSDKRTYSRIPASILRGSGYDRGHLAPNDAIGINFGAEAQRETFLMTNVAPQRVGLNRGAWRSLETFECNHWANELDELWILTGPIFENIEEPKFIDEKKKRMAIPEGFFKIYLDESADNIRVVAISAQQSTEGSIQDLKVHSIDEIETLLKIDFNSILPDPIEDELESRKPRSILPKHW